MPAAAIPINLPERRKKEAWPRWRGTGLGGAPKGLKPPARRFKQDRGGCPARPRTEALRDQPDAEDSSVGKGISRAGLPAEAACPFLLALNGQVGTQRTGKLATVTPPFKRYRPNACLRDPATETREKRSAHAHGALYRCCRWKSPRTAAWGGRKAAFGLVATNA